MAASFPSAGHDGGDPALDVVHLLPPVARELLNVYHLASAEGAAASCYWTALNFPSEQPESRLLVNPRTTGDQEAETWRRLQEFTPLEKASELGDIIAYRRKSDGRILHVCSYVAADIVFTKNGFGYSAPWCLMRLPDVDALYHDAATTERLYFRPR